MTYVMFGLMSMTSYTLVFGETIGDISSGISNNKFKLCLPLAELITGAWLVPVCCIIRKLNAAFWIALINFILILLPIILALYDMIKHPIELTNNEMPKFFATNVTFLDVMGSFANTIFAYCGQWMYFEGKNLSPNIFLFLNNFLIAFDLLSFCFSYA